MGGSASAGRELVDWHTHVWLPEHLGAFGKAMDADDDEPYTTLADYEQHQQAMADAGVTACVVIGLSAGALGLNIPNDFVAEYAQQSAINAVGVASVDPTEPGAVDEVVRAKTELGLQAIKLAPPYAGFHPHSPEAWAVYSAAAELSMPLIFHQGWVFDSRCTLDDANPLLLDRVAREFPFLPIIIAHLGQPWVAETIAVMSRHEHVYSDVSARFSQPWTLYNGLMLAVERGVESKILFGSDFPIFTPGRAAQLLRELPAWAKGLPEIRGEFIEDMLYNRPLSLLGFEPHVPAEAA